MLVSPLFWIKYVKGSPIMTEAHDHTHSHDHHQRGYDNFTRAIGISIVGVTVLLVLMAIFLL